MEYLSYYIVFPNNDVQEIPLPLKIGDVVDINGIKQETSGLNPKKIAYRVSGMRETGRFKEKDYYFKLELLTAEEVGEEKTYRTAQEKKLKAKYDRVFEKMAKKASKKRRFF